MVSGARGYLFPRPLCFEGFLTAKEGVVSFFLVLCLPPTIVCLSVCLPVFIPLCLSREPRGGSQYLGQIAPHYLGRRETAAALKMELGFDRAFITSPVTSSTTKGLQGLPAATG